MYWIVGRPNNGSTAVWVDKRNISKYNCGHADPGIFHINKGYYTFSDISVSALAKAKQN